ncbi:unnamed protein product, partial [Brachionus calyciflorus]
MISLIEKVSIITGASSGIGRGTAIFFSNLGSKLVITGRDEHALDETISKCCSNVQKNIIKVVGDITNAEICQKIVEEAIKNFRKIDILINNAGALKTGSIQTMKIEDYDYLMNVNTRSAIV